MSKINEDLDIFNNSIPAEIKVIKTTNTARGEEIGKMLSQVIRANEARLFVEPTCPICTSPYRKEIEQKFIELPNRNFSEVKTFANEKYNLDISLPVIENHCIIHLTLGLKEQQKIEYAQSIARLYSQPLTTLDHIRLSFSVLMERLMGINSITPSTVESSAKIEQIKSQETVKIMGTVEKLLKLQATILGEMKDGGELFSFPRKEFLDIFNELLVDAKTEGEKQILVKLLERLEILSTKTQ
jgi:hypothetical protein